MNLAKKVTLDLIEADDSGFSVKGQEKFGKTKGKRIFFRADYNVPLKNGNITDTTRITSTLLSLRTVIGLKPDVLILTSHLGRPEGNVVPKLTLKPVVAELEKLLNTKITFIENWYRDGLQDEIAKLPKGSIVVLENIRFYLEEEGKGTKDGKKAKASKDDIKKFRQFLSSLCDLYINDAFGCCHRDHSSISGVEVPIRVAGFLISKELRAFDQVFNDPKRPYLAILGGAKVADKIQVIRSLLDKVDEMVIAGGMCFTFLKILNKMKIGNSLFDEEGAKIVEELAKLAQEKKVKLILPVDFICGSEYKEEAKSCEADIKGGIPDGFMGLDIGVESRNQIAEAIARAKTIVWNGPPGVFEFPNFANGTKAVLESIAKATADGSVSIVGGGDSAAACVTLGYEDKVTHVSTGGGASLELLEGKVLPGVAFISEL